MSTAVVPGALNLAEQTGINGAWALDLASERRVASLGTLQILAKAPCSLRPSKQAPTEEAQTRCGLKRSGPNMLMMVGLRRNEGECDCDTVRGATIAESSADRRRSGGSTLGVWVHFAGRS